MAVIHNEQDLALLRESGRRLGAVLATLEAAVEPGVTTKELDELAYEQISAGGDTPAFLNYQPDFSSTPFPGSVCVAINDEVVHGIPDQPNRTLAEGDIIGLDCGLIHEGLYSDSAITVPVGEVSADTRKLLNATREALNAGINAVHAGVRVGDIGEAISAVAEREGLGLVRELGGHGLGYSPHSDPMIPNFGRAGDGVRLPAGSVIALEPMFTLGGDDIQLDPDGWTIRTRDASRSAQFEHSLLVTEEGADVLTVRPEH
jgi:methionyl aminopeptidase